MSAEVATLDPRHSTRALDVKVTRLVHRGLVDLHEATLEPVAGLAESWQATPAGGLRVTLRSGVRFHSGAPFEAEDVCATLDALRDPALGSPHRAVVRAVSSCSVLGPRVLEITLGTPRATLLTDLEVPILRRDQARSAPRPEGDLDGLGAYRVRRVRAGEVELEPAPGTRAPALVIRSVRDENARAQRLLAGRADLAPGSVSPALLPAFEQRGLSVRSRPGANLTYLLIQNERAPLDRSEVRRALAQAIDRELITRTLLAGRARSAEGWLPPGHWALDSASRPLPWRHDPAAARTVLAGLPEQELLVGTDRLRAVIARAMAQMWADAGLPVRVVSLDTGALFDRLDRGDYALAMLQIPELTEPAVLGWFLHPRGVPGEGGEGRNRARYRSATAARWFDAAMSTPERDTRRQAYAELWQVLHADLPVVPLWHEDQVVVGSARARDFLPSAEGRWAGLARLGDP